MIAFLTDIYGFFSDFSKESRAVSVSLAAILSTFLDGDIGEPAEGHKKERERRDRERKVRGKHELTALLEAILNSLKRSVQHGVLFSSDFPF